MTSKSPPPVGAPQLAPKEGIELLNAQINRAKALLSSRPIKANDYSTWELVVRNVLEKAFGTNSPNVAAIIDVGKYGAFPMSATEGWWEDHRAKSLETQIRKMVGLIEVLETEATLAEGSRVARIGTGPRGHRIFLVHGRDDAALHHVARFLERLQQDVIVLREQPNAGHTIIEKFELFADVGFAVVLLTPDDRGGLFECPPENQRPRSRQNVVFEMGYFIGRLGRNRVCCLYREGVELPSDYAGVAYVSMDENGNWRLEIARELKAAGLPIDMNRAL